MRLPELRQQDLRLISDLSADMLACRDFVELENCIHANIRNIVDGDVSIWNLINTDGTIVYGSTWPQFDEKFWSDVIPVIARDISLHPTVKLLIQNQPKCVANLNSELSFYRGFLESDLHNCAYSKWNCLDQCQGSFLAEPDTYLNIAVNRSNRSFSKRELQSFELLIPLLADVFKIVRRRQNLEMQFSVGRMNHSYANQFWLTISSLLYIRNGSPNAQAMLRNLFPGHFSLVELPELLDNHLRKILSEWIPGIDVSRRFALQTNSTRVECELEQVDPVTYKLTGTLPDRQLDRAPVQLPVMGAEKLSPRELDVLGWTLEGKLTPEIAIILSIQPKTVEKHLQSIYEKLGIHSRTALISMTQGI